MLNRWPQSHGLPRAAKAVLAALHLDEPRTDLLAALSEDEWASALGFCDQSRLTLWLRAVARGAMPPAVRERMDRNAANNLVRARGMEELLANVSAWLGEEGLEFVALKGLTHTALFGSDAALRAQYDLDLWLPRPEAERAQAALIRRGYMSLPGMDVYPTDHFPALFRKTTWEFRGDFFDIEIPLSIEVHFRFWNEELEHLPAPGVEEFWERRTMRTIGGTAIGVLAPADALAYAALHQLRHLLRGSAKPFHAYEIARILDEHAEEPEMWRAMREWHSPELRRLEAVVFRLSREWFGGRAAPDVEEEIERLPASTKMWFEEFAESPVARAFSPNKDELWLHMSLLDSRRAAWSVARRRLLPKRLPPYGETARVAEGSVTWTMRLRHRARYVAYALSRVRHHALSLPRTGISGARWWWRTNNLGAPFWVFLASAVVFNFALFIYVLLYNLLLMDSGYREDFLGVVNSATRLGSFAGTLPAALVARRLGLRRTLVFVIAGTSAAEVLRALAGARFPLAALAFVSGCIFSLWAVILAPAIAGSVSESRRPTAFSVFFACMFATGIFGNWLGGRLPLWMGGKQTVLIAAAALSSLAVIPALWWKHAGVADEAPAEGRIYPRSRFLLLFLIPFAIWHLATGTFNPFNNVYFRRLGFADHQIGSVLSGSQLVQVVAVLFAPWVIRKLGLVRAIVWMMLATAISLGGLATRPAAGAAVGAYAAYMSFQWMSEPGLNTLLMNQVAERERSGASSIIYLIAFGAQALAAFAGGALMTRAGYGIALTAAAVLAGAAALLFRRLLSPEKLRAPTLPAVADDTARG